MRWAWQQDYRDRPSAAQLQDILSYSSVPHLVDAYPLVPFVYAKVCHIHTYIPIYMCTYVHTYIHAYTYIHTYIHIYTYIYTYIHT